MKLSFLLRELIKTLNSPEIENCQFLFDQWARRDCYRRPCGSPLYLLTHLDPYMMQDYFFFIHVEAGKGRPVYLAENSSDEKPTPYYDYEAVNKLMAIPHDDDNLNLAKLLFSESTYDGEFISGGDWYVKEAYLERFTYIQNCLNSLKKGYGYNTTAFIDDMPYRGEGVSDSFLIVAYNQMYNLVKTRRDW